MPLADTMRPQQIEEVVGQRHILGKGKVLTRIMESNILPNMIFYGPSGTGKSTVAKIIAKNTDKQFFRLNATTISLSDMKEVMKEADSLLGANGVLLFLDEIQYLNKKQQQSLLDYIETGRVTLIASTTENPYFYVYSAILSRSTVFEFKPITSDDILPVLKRGIAYAKERLQIDASVSVEALEHIAQGCGGDVRKALNALELCLYAGEKRNDQVIIDKELAKQFTQQSIQRFDRSGDEHYDTLSGLQKSIRGSDPDAALHYLGRLLAGGDMLSAIRRLLVIAAEDIGLAYPQAIVITKACVDSALQIGLPEARIPLAEAVVLLATAPKSDSAYKGIAKAMEDIQNGKGIGYPRCVQNQHTDGEGGASGQNYRNPHGYAMHYVEQNYLPDDLIGRQYYTYGENKTEQTAQSYWKAIKAKNGNRK